MNQNNICKDLLFTYVYVFVNVDSMRMNEWRTSSRVTNTDAYVDPNNAQKNNQKNKIF